ARRIALADRYNHYLRPLAPLLRTPLVAAGATHVYQMYTVEIGDDRRDAVLRHLLKRGVGGSVHFDPPVHLQPYYNSKKFGTLPVTEQLARELVSLPLFPDMTESDQDWVIHCVQEALDAG